MENNKLTFETERPHPMEDDGYQNVNLDSVLSLENLAGTALKGEVDDLALVNRKSENATPKKPKILTIEHAPDWLVDNKYIIYGYRVDFTKKTDLLKSLFMKHNELMNIWTHLIGGIVFVGLVFYTVYNYDIFSVIFSKIKDLVNPQNLQKFKDVVPQLLAKIE